MRQTGWSDMLTEREADFTCSYTVVPLPLVTADLKQTNKPKEKDCVMVQRYVRIEYGKCFSFSIRSLKVLQVHFKINK